MVGWLSDLWEPGLHLTPSCSVLNPEPDKEAAGGSPGQRPRHQRQTVCFIAVLREPASICQTCSRLLLKPALLRVQRRAESPPAAPFIHASYLFFFSGLGLIHPLTPGHFPGLTLFLFSQQWVTCSPVSRLAVPSHFCPGPLSLSLFLLSHCLSHSQTFSASPPSSDYYSDTAYPAVISLITFKQLSVALSPTTGLPLHTFTLIACSFLCECLQGSVFHCLTTRDKYSYSAYIFLSYYRWVSYV